MSCVVIRDKPVESMPRMRDIPETGDRRRVRYRGLLTGDTSPSRHVIKRQVSHAALVDAASWSNFTPSVARRGFLARRRIYRFYGPSIETASASLRSRIPLLSPSRILCRALAPPGLSGIPRKVFIIISTEVRSLISNWTNGSHRGNKRREGERGEDRSSLYYYVVKRVRGDFLSHFSFLLSRNPYIST